MATDSTTLPQGETTLLDAGMTGSDLDLTTVQEAANEPANYVDLPKGNTVILLPVQPGQTVRLPTDGTDGVLAKIGPEGNLALVVDGRTIILQGFLKANDQTPIKIVTNDGDDIDVAELVAATDPSLDIQTAAGPASGDQGDGADGSGIYIPFLAGPGLGGILAEGILDPTALQYRLIDDEYKEFTLDENGKPLSIEIIPDEGRPIAEDGAFLLDEDDLTTGTAGGPNDDPGTTTSSGTVVVNFGSDGPRAVDPIIMTGVVNGNPSGLFALAPGATTQGDPILLQLDPPAGGVQVLHGLVGAVEYFRITLDTTTGHFEVEQLLPLWHPDHNDTEDNVLLQVQFTAFDATGDSISDILGLSFDDDSPVIVDCGCEPTNLLTNGSFEDLGTEDDGKLENGNWGVFSQIPGWKSGADEGNPSGLPGLEIQNNVVLVAKDGKHYVELDSDNLDQTDPAPSTTNAYIYQDVNTIDGNNYVLSFSYSPRTGDKYTDGIEVWFDGKKIATIKTGTVGEWSDYTFVVKAGEGDGTPDVSRLKFKAVGSPNELGGLIDNVSLTACALVDEDGLKKGIEGGPGDDGVGIGTCFSGSLGVNFGADGAHSIEFSETNQPALTSGGQEVKYDWQGTPDGKGTLVAYIGDNPGDSNSWVFTVAVESLDNGGEYKLELLKPLDHPDTNNDPTDDDTDDGQSSFEDNLIFKLEFKATDGDGDTATGHLKVNVDDDSPDACKVEISFCDEDNKLVHDETGGKQIGGKWFPWDHDPDASGQPEDDTWHVKGFEKFEQEEHCLDAIGYAKTELKIDLSGGGYCENAAFGADGPGTVSPVSIVAGNGGDFCGEKTNLKDTKTGSAIFLFTEEVCGETFVVGRVGGKGGPVSFALTVSDCGDLELAQYRAIEHPNGCDSDESLKLLDCEGGALVYLQVTVTDNDGDAVTAKQALDGCHGNPAIVFQDDGPCVTECPGGKVVLAMDETDKFQLFPQDQNFPEPNGQQDGPTPEGDWLSNIATVLEALFPFPIPHVLGAAKDNVQGLFKVNFGTDGGCVVCYDLTILNDGKTNLVDTESGTCITLSKGPNGIVEGRDGEGNLVFAICLDKDSGEIVSVQFRAIDHGDEASEGPYGAHDEVTSLLQGILGVTATAFDKDGDKDSKTVDIGCGIIFEDDGPKFEKVDWGNDGDSTTRVNGTGLIDEDALPHGIPYGPGDNDGGKSADGKVIFDFGSDKPGKVEINALEVRDHSGNTVLLKITLDGSGNLVVNPNNLQAIDNKTLAFDKSLPDVNGVVTWTAYIAGHPSEKVFTFSLDTSGANIGAFDFCLLQPLEHLLTNDPQTQAYEKAFEDNFKFDFTIRGYDGDGDAADGHVKLSVDDDSPKVEACEGASLCLAMDETDKFQLIPSDYDQPGVPNGPLDGNTTEGDWLSNLAAIFDAIFPGNVPDVLGAAKDNVDKLFKVGFGADGGCVVCYDLTILGDGKTNLRDTETGTCITLVDCGGGVVKGVDEVGNVVFAVWLDKDSGEIITAQFRAIDHGGEEGKPGAHDEIKALCEGVLGVTATATDNDGDKACTTVDIGKGILFEDDGPKVEIEKKDRAEIRLDESLTPGAGEPSDPNAGDETTTPENDIAYKKVSGGSLFHIETENYGSDGAKSREFSLTINGDSNSGLYDVQTGLQVQLSKNGNVITGAVNGETVFTITIDPTNGDVAVQQFRAVKHNDPTDPDENGNNEPSTMSSNKLLLVLTITDGDCDSASDSIDLGKLIKFEDDAPFARDDVDNIETTDGGATYFAAGNVVTGDGVQIPGVDDVGTDIPGGVTKIRFGGTSDVTFTGGFLEVNGAYGTLKIDGAGNYTYDFNEGADVPSGGKEVFHYTFTDKDGDPDEAKLTIQFPEVKIPEAKIGVGPELNGSYKEDVQNAIHFSVDPQGDDTVVHVKITGLTGWTIGAVDIPGAADTANLTFDPVTGTLEFDVTGAVAGDTITGSFTATPPEDTDQDFPLSIEGTVQDGPVQAKDTGNATVVVDAVLDQYVDVTGNSQNKAETAGVQTLNLGLTSALAGNVAGNPFLNSGAGGADGDGSEVATVQITVNGPANAAGVDLVLMAGFPAGASLTETAPGSGTYNLTANSVSDLQTALTFIGAQLPAGFDGTVSGTVTATTQEANTPEGAVGASGDEPDVTDNTKTDAAGYTLTVLATPSPEIALAGGIDTVCVPEDTVSNPIAVSASASAGSHLTQIVIEGFPTGAGAFTLNLTGLDTDGVGGNVVVDTSQLASQGKVTITLSGGQTSYNGSFTVKAPADSDVDLGNLTATVTAANNVDPSLTGTDNDGTYVQVDAVADGKDDANGGDGDASVLSVAIAAADSGDAGTEFSAGETGILTLNATFDDFQDGSEKHQITIEAPAGFQFTGAYPGGLPAGVIVNVGLSDANTLVLDVDSTGGDGVASIVNLQIGVQNVSAGQGVTADFTATATAVEQNTIATNNDGNKECTDANNSQSVSDTASVTSQTNLIPIAYDDKKCGDEAGPQNANIMVILDVSGSMNNPSGVGSLTKLEAAKQATINMLNAYADTGGDVRVMLVWFNSSAEREEAWLSVDDAIEAINDIPASGDSASTDYQDAITTAISGFQDTDGRGDPATHPGFVYFLSDGQPNNGGNPNDDGDGLPNNGITPATLTAWNNLLETNANNVEHVYSVGFGAGIPDGANNVHLISVANPDNDAAPGDPNGTVVFVDDLNDLSATLTGTVGTLNEGNVLDGSIENDDSSPNGPVDGDGSAPAPGDADNVGDGFSHVSFFEYNHPTDNGLDITITWNGAGLPMVDGVANGENTIVNGSKVSFDTEHGRMTFDLSNGDYDFIAGSIDGGDKEEHFTYKITDSNDDQSNAADLIVCIKDVFVDKTPITYDDVASGAEPAPKSVNLLLVFDNSGSMDDPSGIPNTTKLEAAKEAAINMLNAYAATGGDVRVMLVTFNSGATREGQWLNLADAIDAIEDIPQSNSNTNYEAAITTAIAGFNDPDGRGDFATHDNFVYFLSDGEPTTGGNSGDNSITDGTLTAWDNLLENPANQIDHVYAVGLGEDIPNGAGNSNLIDVARPDGNNNPANTVILVDDFNDLSATLTGTIGTPIVGNILTGVNELDADGPNAGGGNDADNPGDGPAHLSHFEYDSADNDLDIKITWDGAGAVVVDGAANGKATSINGKEVSFDTDHGRMTIDFSDGDFKFVPESISGGNKTEVFDYKTTDFDGDVSNESKLSVTIENLPGVVTIGDATVNESGNANVQVKLSEAAPVGGVTVNYTFQTKVGNTATGGGTDYNTVTSSIFIAAGATTGLIPVNAVADAFFEGNETYSVVITSVTGGSYTVADDTGLVTILDKTTLTEPVQPAESNPSGFPSLNGNSDNGFTDGDDKNVDGEDGEDGFAGEGGADEIDGLGGDDHLDGEGGDDDLDGGSGEDQLVGDTGADTLHGGAGDDILFGGDNADDLFGDGDDDEISGGSGTDELHGGEGDDYLFADDDDDLDTLFGDGGDDVLRVETNDLGVGRQIDGGAGNDILDIGEQGDLSGSTGITNIEVVTMEPGNDNDSLTVSAADVLAMTDANNKLFVWGDSGDDSLNLLNSDNWQLVGNNVDGGSRNYNVYQSGGATLFVDTDVDVNFS